MPTRRSENVRAAVDEAAALTVSPALKTTGCRQSSHTEDFVTPSGDPRGISVYAVLSNDTCQIDPQPSWVIITAAMQIVVTTVAKVDQVREQLMIKPRIREVMHGVSGVSLAALTGAARALVNGFAQQSPFARAEIGLVFFAIHDLASPTFS